MQLKMVSSGKSEITYVTTYYNEPDLLEFVLENFLTDFYSALIIVDDASQIHPAEPIVRKYEDKLPVTLLRVKDDLGFNSHGARNLAMQHVQTEWAYMTDIDIHTDVGASYDLWKAVQSSQLKQYFTFWRGHKQDFIGRCEEGYNDLCLRVSDFWESYGYDEEYTGIHYGDKMFLQRLNSYMVRTLLPNIIIDKRMKRKTISNAKVNITTYDNENNIMYHPIIKASELKKLNDFIGSRNENKDTWATKSVVNFEWEKIIG